MRKAIFLFFIFWFLAIFQTSFFGFMKFQPNLVLVLFLLILIFSEADDAKIMSAAFGGFFLDIFSNFLVGVNIFVLFAIYFLTKMILKNIHEINLGSLIFFLLFGALAFEIFLPGTSLFFSKIFNASAYLKFGSGYSIFIKVFLSLLLGIFGFFSFKAYQRKFV